MSATKIQKPVLKETLHIAVGVLICDAVMLAVFALLGKFDITVVLGALLGSAAAVGNFFLLGISLQKALDTDHAQKFMRTSYTWRMMLYIACIAVAFLVPCFHPVAAIIPLFMPRLVIYAMQLMGLYKPQSPAAAKEEQPKVPAEAQEDRPQSEGGPES